MRRVTARSTFKAGGYRAGFTLLEIIAVFIVIGIVLTLILGRMNRSTNPDAVADLDALKTIVRDAQIKAMADSTHAWTAGNPGVAWNVAVNSKTATLSQGNTVIRTYTMRTTYSAISVSFDNMGRPQSSTGTWPFAINATTGYIQ